LFVLYAEGNKKQINILNLQATMFSSEIRGHRTKQSSSSYHAVELLLATSQNLASYFLAVLLSPAANQLKTHSSMQT